jgi:hypothetical protein
VAAGAVIDTGIEVEFAIGERSESLYAAGIADEPFVSAMKN